VQWFGEDWGAPVCRESDHVDTPVDFQCLYCPRLIDEGDQGFLMPYYSENGYTVVAVHRDCLLRAVLPDETNLAL
jgi:hypothetical protein